LAIGLVDSGPQAKRIANPLQDTILPHNLDTLLGHSEKTEGSADGPKFLD
jgi:hypothetical protein